MHIEIQKDVQKVLAHIREEIREYMSNKEKRKRENEVLPDVDKTDSYENDEDDGSRRWSWLSSC